MEIKTHAKEIVREFWNAQSCGEIYALGDTGLEYYESHRRARYALEPYIFDFARFCDAHDKDVLEIGVGMGADHTEWAKQAPRTLTGIDLTPRAVEHTTKRLQTYGLKSKVQVADAENLPFPADSFDLVYSWGVLHHSPDTPKAIKEVFRILRPGGIARIMIYHRYSMTAYLLWIRYALLTGNPARTLDDVVAQHLESPGTKVYSVSECTQLFTQFKTATITIKLNLGDLLQGAVGQRHGSFALSLAKLMWPRWLITKIFRNHGLMLLIDAEK